jgi:hypothetical protein
VFVWWWLAVAVVAVVAAAVVELGAGGWHRTGRATTTHVTAARSGTCRQVVVVFPGFTMSGRLVAAAFAPHLGRDDAMVVVGYADRGMDMGAMYAAVMAQIDQLGATVLRLYGGSMGGLCALKFLDQLAASKSTVEEVILVLDTAPSSVADVRTPRWLLGLAGSYRGGPIGTMVWAATSALERRARAEQDSDAELIEASRRAERWVGMPAVASQAHFIASTRIASVTRPRPGPYRLLTRVTYLHGRDATDDPLINIGRALAGWRRLFPDLHVRGIDGRAGRWHLPLVARPREVVQAILAA